MTNRRLLVAVLLSVTLIPLNSTMMAVGIVPIAHGLSAPVSYVVWVVTAYLIVMAATQPITGKLGDIFGQRRLLLTGLVTFLGSSMAAASIPHLWALIAFRSGQALGGALIMPNALAILRRTYAGPNLPKVLGIVNLSQGLSAALGPLVASILIQWAGWPAMFWVNLPIALLAVILGWRSFPEVPSRSRSIDVYGSLSLAGFLAFLALTLTHVKIVPWPLALTMMLTLMAVFVWAEHKAKDPVVRWLFFRNRGFRNANFAILVNNFFMYSLILYIPMSLRARPDGVALAGVLLFALSIVMSLNSWLGSRLAPSLGPRRLVGVAFALDGLVVLWLFSAGSHATIGWLSVGMILAGVGVGLGLTAMQVTSLESVGPDNAGSSSGIYSTFRYLGSISSSALLALMVSNSNARWILLALAAVIGLGLSRGFPEQRHGLVPVDSSAR